jgi:hypothetical protein
VHPTAGGAAWLRCGAQKLRSIALPEALSRWRRQPSPQEGNPIMRPLVFWFDIAVITGLGLLALWYLGLP